MSTNESHDEELVNAIEAFLRSAKNPQPEEPTASIDDIRPEWRELVPDIMSQGADFDYLLSIISPDVSTTPVPHEKAIVVNERLNKMAAEVSTSITTSGISSEDKKGIVLRQHPTPESNFEAFQLWINRGLIPAFLSDGLKITTIEFENWLSGNIEEDRAWLSNMLGVNDERPIGKLVISGVGGAIRDPQTRNAMEKLSTEYPLAPLLGHFYTEYYFLGNRIAKIVSLPPELLRDRIIMEERNFEGWTNERKRYALSEMTAGDLAIIEACLSIAQQSVNSLTAV
jgi:hypothetical protein